jgi:FkbM family methyltransferase
MLPKDMFYQAYGHWWPIATATKEANPEKMEKNYIRRAPDMEAVMRHVRGKHTVVQAGGHCGMWPLWLSSRFKNVYTFEPDLLNFTCLAANVCARDNVYAARGLLGETRGTLTLNRSTKWIGAHHGVPEIGPVPTYVIDDMALSYLDALILDVEGMELPALKGAVRSIEKFKPVIMLEERGHGARYGWGGYERITALLGNFGYAEAERVQHDVVLKAA